VVGEKFIQKDVCAQAGDAILDVRVLWTFCR